MDARVRPRKPDDPSVTCAEIAIDPIQHEVGRGCGLGQRHQPPVRTRPFAVRVASEPAVLLLTGEQSL